MISHVAPAILHAALIQLAAGDERTALATSARFANDLAPSRRAIARLIGGERLRLHEQPDRAVAVFRDALKLQDTPFVHFLLARAALDAKRYGEATSALAICLARCGEVVIDVSEVPMYHYVPLFTLYLARAQAALGRPEARASYAAVLATMSHADPSDPIAADVRAHARQ
jgi:hypothetical protein